MACLTCVFHKGKYVIAHKDPHSTKMFGNHLITFLGRKFDKKQFIKGLRRVREPDPSENIPHFQAKLTGSALLSEIQFDHMQAAELIVKKSLDFAGDSLLCDWVYVVDLDKDTFETFRGQNDTATMAPDDPQERFAHSPCPTNEDSAGYDPVRFVISYPLKELPLFETYFDTIMKKDPVKLAPMEKWISQAQNSWF